MADTIIGNGELGKDKRGRVFASCSVQVGWEPEGEPTVALHLSPAVLTAPGASLPETEICVDLYVDGVRTTPDSVWISSDINDLNLEGEIIEAGSRRYVRLWGDSLESGMVEIGASLDNRNYFGQVQLTCYEIPSIGHELFCLNPVMGFDAEGNASQSAISVSAFRLSGSQRTPLPVNSQAGAEHYCIRRRSNLAEAGATDCSTSFPSSLLKSAAWARFDLVAKSNVTVSGRAFTYSDSDVLASQEIIITRDGVDGSGAAFTSIVFRRSESKPATPQGGTYANPIPTTAGWSDAPENGTDPLWMSRARFAPETTTPQWSEPSPVQDAAGIEFLYNPNEEYAGTPFNTHPHETGEFGWTKEASGAVWMAVSVMNNGIWSDWQIVRVKGEKGDSGRSIWTGPVMEWSSYPEGHQFLTGNTEGDDGMCRRDVVTHGEDSQTHLPVTWTCRKNHAKSAEHEPGKEAGYPVENRCWERGQVFDSVSTRVVMAKEGHIDLMHSQGIRIYDSEGNICGQMSSAQSEPPKLGNRRFPFFIGGIWSALYRTFQSQPLFAVDTNGTTYHGGVSGQHIEISALEKTLKVFDASGSVVATHSGRTLNTADVLQSSSSEDGFMKNVYGRYPAGSGTASSSFSISVHSREGVGSAGSLAITLPAITFTGSATRNASGEGMQLSPAVIVNFIVKVNGYEAINDQLLYADGNGQNDFNINGASTPRQYALDMTKGSSYEAYLRVQLIGVHGVAVTLGNADVKGVYTAPEYAAEYGANGFYLKRDNRNYVYFIFDSSGVLHCKCLAGGVTVFGSQ